MSVALAIIAAFLIGLALGMIGTVLVCRWSVNSAFQGYQLGDYEL